MYALAADLHLGGCLARGKGIDEDWKTAVEDMTDVLREHKVTDLFLAGDSTELERVTGDELNGLKSLTEAVDTVWYIRGNHDGPPEGRKHVLEVLGGIEVDKGEIRETSDGIRVSGLRSSTTKQFREFLTDKLPDISCDILMLHQKESKVYSLMPDFGRDEIPDTVGLTLCGDIHVRDLDDRFLSPGPLVPEDIHQVKHAGYIHLYDPKSRKVVQTERVRVRPVRTETVEDEEELEVLRRKTEGSRNEGIETPYIIVQCAQDLVQTADEVLKELPHKVEPMPPDDALDMEYEDDTTDKKTFGEDTERMFEESLETENINREMKEFSAELVRSGTRSRRKDLIKEILDERA